MKKNIAIIIGAGPAGLTAAYELVMKTDIKPIILEMSQDIGGISKTVNYKGNRIDIGGHRFFSKSDQVMNWWNNILPIQQMPGNGKDDALKISYHNKTKEVKVKNTELPLRNTDKVMLVRHRLSRIFFLGKFFDYPVSLNKNTLKNLGVVRLIKIGISYVYIQLFPIKSEKSLEDFLINRFGKELYLTFFKDYTEKVWGCKCSEISAEWGAQRIKGLSITKAIAHAIKTQISRDDSIKQKNTETSLIQKFLYPKFGPGQMWEEVAAIVQEKGGEIHFNVKVTETYCEHQYIKKIKAVNTKTGEENFFSGDYFFSTMPVRELIRGFKGIALPDNVNEVAKGLIYRDFITVGLLLKQLKVKNETNIKTENILIPDNWIYIQEREVKLGRLQIFNNWSPYMVKDPNNVWIGLEYFCNEGDELWTMPDDDFIKFAINELSSINIIDKEDVLDSTILRMPKAYPAYFGTYNRFQEIRDFTDTIPNLFLIGRNGMHRYNNSDHSMLTAMCAVENIINNITSKDNIWNINTEEEYHETKEEVRQ